MKHALCLLLTLAAACSADSPVDEPLARPQVAMAVAPLAPRAADRVEPDEPGAVAALEKLPVRLVRSHRGVVQGVEMTDPELTDAAMAHLEGLPSLEWLKVGKCKVTDAGLKPLTGLRRLRRLYLYELDLTDAGLAHLGRLAGLEVLALEDTKITGPGLAHLKGLPALRVLNLGDCKVDDDALALLEPLARLETLSLQRTEITDAGLAHLRGLLGLIVVNLNECDVTADGLEHLRPLENLRILRVKNTEITGKQARRFKDGMPGLAVFR